MTAASHPNFDDPDWWRQAVVYQIYPRSFADSDGDGIGDLRGITSRIDYLRDLGVDAVWLSPFYPSALADGGYDVDDYRNVDPRLGTLDDFDELVSALRSAGIRLLVDIVANHSSNKNAWFTAALASEVGSPERNRYIFRDGRGEHGELPPNDWPSHFGPSAWTRTNNPDGTPGQWYLHLFAPEQPDFNWDCPDVAADFLTTLRFWADRGVAGFRVDAAHLLVKDLSEPYRSVPSIGITADYPLDGSHPFVDRDALHDIYRTWRSVFDEYTPPLVAVAETAVGAERRALYASPDELGQAFDFDLLDVPWDAAAMRATITKCLAGADISGSTATWTLSNHDIVRHVSRFALPPATDFNRWLLSNGNDPLPDMARGERRTRASLLLLLALPGSTYLYQGEELGVPEVADLPSEVLQDPQWIRYHHTRKGRDGCRVPLPWTASGSSFGFGSGGSHLPMPTWFGTYSVEREEAESDSMLHFYRAALRERREVLSTEHLTWHDGGDDVVWFSRDNGWHCVVNFGTTPVTIPAGEMLLSSAAIVDGRLPGEAAVWLFAEQ